ncbi:APC family permease [Picrophilus oshimae]|nr:APC family permease [Picrophilus oshimae]
MVATNQNIASDVTEDKKLKKALSTWDLLFLSLGGIIGSGWLFAAAASAGTAGPSAIYAWIIGGVLIIFIALVYAELGGMLPRSGAIVRYGHYSHGGLAGLIFGWAYFLSAVSVPAVEAEGVITYAASYTPKYHIILATTSTNPITGVPLLILTPLGILLAAILIVAFFMLNYAGVRLMGKTNTGMTWWKLIIPAATIVILFVVGFHTYEFTDIASGGFLPYGWPAVFAAVSTDGIVFSYLGFRQAVDYGGEAKTPQKSIPIAVIGSVLIGIFVYVLLQVVFIGHLNLGAIGNNWSILTAPPTSNAYATSISSAPFATLATSAGLVALTYILYADAYVSPSGTLNVYAGTSARTLFGLGENGYLPESIKRVNKRTKVPVLSIILSMIIGLVFLAPFPSWYALVSLITSSTAFTYIVGGSALMVFRREAGELKRPFKLAGASILAPIAFIGATLIVYWSGWPTVGILSIAIFLGLLVYFILLLLARYNIVHGIENIFTNKTIKAGIWVPAYILILDLLSYIGEKDYGGIGILKFPIDFLVVIVVGIIFYVISYYSGYRTEEISNIIESGTQYIGEETETAGAK